ncbi:cob(I)yrinic acid a,c-diamide adenosyltransferase [Vibrio sp. MA40-2]|uniref:cob(I)yrinic acid a,c-diamide adenosyltransferase n=1 Tax=Vibrio sp. MA40-2 TaxID=3391828 RepID=UPI0039A593CD
MSIYTKKGDAGSTSLVGGVRVNKSDEQVETYGTIDELNSCISLASKTVQDSDNIALLESIQHQLFYLGAEIATAKENAIKTDQKIVEDSDIEQMEKAIDRCMSALPPVRSFILPGSSESGSRLHYARTIARRAERRLVSLAQLQTVRPVVLKYINRLSDFLYALARHEDQLNVNKKMINQIVNNYLEATTLSTQATSSSQTQDQQQRSEEPIMPPTMKLNFAHVHQMMKQAVDAAMKLAVPVVISVVDNNGHLIMTYRMPDALLVSTELAPKKAYTSVALKTATHQLSELVQPRNDLYQLESMCDGKIITFGGGIPLYSGKELLGAIGISGGTVAQDVDIALAAIKNLDLEEN